jgi:hypothetical protein
VPLPVRARVDSAQHGRKAAGVPEVQVGELGPAEEVGAAAGEEVSAALCVLRYGCVAGESPLPAGAAFSAGI